VSHTAKCRIVDLSHTIEHGMITYPGLPAPEISDHLSRAESRTRYAPGTEFAIGRITMVANTGTYLDAPFHRYPDGPDLSELDLARLVDIDGIVIDAPSGSGPGVTRDALTPHLVAGRGVLIRTGWDRHWGASRYGAPGHPFLTADAVAWLVEQRPAVVGIDSVNIDDMTDLARPAHTGLLGAHVPIIEHMRGLDQLPASGFRLHVAPAPVAGLGSFPVRAYAIVR
jgi:kynurenine formamidase